MTPDGLGETRWSFKYPNNSCFLVSPGLIIVVGLTSTLVYVLLVKRFASEEGDDVEGGYDEGDWKLMEAAAAGE
jgi:hypothetical protein